VVLNVFLKEDVRPRAFGPDTQSAVGLPRHQFPRLATGESAEREAAHPRSPDSRPLEAALRL
jgi:hypothetical protein